MYIVRYLRSHQLTSSIGSDIPNDQGVTAIQKGQGLT